MTKLFIIGNGFDLAHDLPTSYENFKQYLLKEYPDVNLNNGLYIPSSIPLPKGGVKYDDSELVSVLVNMIDQVDNEENKWSDLENSLAVLDYEEFFLGFDDVLDKDGTINYSHTTRRNEDLANELYFTTEIKTFFTEWIGSIELYEVKAFEEIKKKIKTNDLFLTFNYTETLEKIYNIHVDNICHIHRALPRQTQSHKGVFFGHGDDEYTTNGNFGSEDNLNTIKKALRKDTDLAYEWNSDFFYDLSNKNISQVYSYGFSYNNVDMHYIEKIIEQVDTCNVIWHFTEYDYQKNSDVIKWKEKLKDSGFKGSFDSF